MDPGHKKILIQLSVIIGLIWIATPIVCIFIFGAPDGPGTFGDIYGSTNALFSGLALLGIIVAILLQHKELTLSTKELGTSARALSKQVELAADTARMQALPILIELQKARIKTYGGKFFHDFDSHEFTEEWMRDRIGEMRSVLATAEAKLAELKTQLDNTPSQRDHIWNQDPARDPLIHEMTELQDRLNVSRGVLPQMERLMEYMNDMTTLYNKMATTKLEDEA